MAKTRLAKWSRDEILSHIEIGIQAPKEQKEYDRAMKAAHAVILKAVRKKYSLEDMEVLKKYNLTRLQACGTVISPTGQVIGFSFPHKRDHSTNYNTESLENIELPIVPTACCEIRNLLVTQNTAVKIENWNFCKEALKEAKNKKLNDYRSLVLGSKYIEDLEEILPFEADFFDKFKNSKTSIIVSGELIERIKSDTLVFENADQIPDVAVTT